jgi:LmbE family N-acetylglucosaminyl deacetylase
MKVIGTPYHRFAADFASLAREGRTLPLGGFPIPPPPPVPANAPKALIFSPHPDDECVIGALALRLLRESQMRVVNVAVTQGSNSDRQLPRLAELRDACAYLGFDLVQTGPRGFERVSTKTRSTQPAAWEPMVRKTAEILEKHQPQVVFFPHDADWNSTHEGVHWLLVDAMSALGSDFSSFCVETEFWGQCDDPNLMVESSPQDVGDLLAALSFHVGEVTRNPYHIALPAWMMDNVRRGGELVGGQGGAAPAMTFATLYRLRLWQKGRFVRFYPGGRNLGAAESPDGLWKIPSVGTSPA